MKIAVTVRGKDLNAQVSDKPGTASHLLVMDMVSKKLQWFEGSGKSGRGAGLQFITMAINERCDVFLTGWLRPVSERQLGARGITVVTGMTGIMAVHVSLNVFSRLLLPFCLVFCFMVVLNLFLTPPQFEKIAQNGSGIKQTFFAAIAGILSTGPIFAWYPILKELRDRGAAPSLMAVFLVNRAVKPALLPMLISLFGWPFVLLFTFLTVAASFCMGFCMKRLAP